MSKHRTRTTRWDRLLSGVLCLALVLGLLPAAGLIQTAEANWADPYGQQLVEWGVMTPTLASNLGADITRAEFVAMCNRAFGYKKLGRMPFLDVPSSAWYAEDINIAYNAGYFTGVTTDPSRPLAAPNDPLTREMAAVTVARNMMLQETVGESLGFTDSHELSEWSRGLIGAAVAEGVITGLPDGSFGPAKNITRGEVAALLVRLIGTPVNKEGSYELGDVYGNVTISSSNATLRNTTIAGNLYVTGGVDLGNVLLENVTVLGRIVISGGGESHEGQSSVVLRNVTADEMLVDSMVDQFVTISAYGLNDIPFTSVRSDAFLEDASEAGHGLHYIELDGEAGTLLQLAGNVKEVKNLTPFSDLQLVQGTAQKITVDERARGSQMLVDIGTRVDELNLDVATLVTGNGDIKHLIIGASGCEVDILPEELTIRPGITATIDGQVMGSTDASDLSSEPRLLAGYPNVVDIAPTSAQGLFAGNKPGTIYWAVSELADGSVSVDDLIRNPVYGGNIFAGQAGSISASSRTEYGRQINSLVPDGSYYISAVLVDGRGNMSPLKVAAFTTPDNTVPAFVKGYPYMSKNTCETAQVTAMPNKNCQLYYALLPAGADAPTEREFKTGAIGGNYGYGSVSVVKNVPVSITVNRNKLQEKTTYWLYLWLTDHNGVQSMATPVRLEFTTPDETPPVVALPMQTEYAENTAGVTFSINEAPSTLYWAVVAEGNETFIAPDTDLTSLRTKIKVENGSGAIVSGRTAAAGANVDTLFTINKLDFKTTKTHNFIMYYVAKDAAGNYSEVVGSIPIQTLDNDPPTVYQEFTNTVDGKLRADSDIRLVFSEQVRGGTTAEMTFLDYYDAVLNTVEGSDAREAAKEALGRELAAHIELYRRGEDEPLTPRHELSAAQDANWVIDWREATVKLEPTGNVVITLPAGTAVRLESGATYYFQLLAVFDNAVIANGIAADSKGMAVGPDDRNIEASIGGNARLPDFTTVYAQVELVKRGSISKIDNGEDDPLTRIRLDMCFDVIPKSTSNVPDTEYWDLVMWSDTSMMIDIYRLDIGPDGDGIWEWVAGGIDFVVRSSGSNPIRNPGRSLGGVLPGTLDDRFTTVRDGLQEEHTYRYGIHITQIGDIRETDEKAEPTSWSGSVTMHFSVIAGDQNDLNMVSANVNLRYDDYVKADTVHEIGVVKETEESILEYKQPFLDTTPPAFQSAYPVFTKGSGSITMQVALDHEGRVYFAVAEAPLGPDDPDKATQSHTITTYIDTGTPINVTNDGSQIDDDEYIKNITNAAARDTARDAAIDKAFTGTDVNHTEITPPYPQKGEDPTVIVDKTYIPISGSDRERYKDYIYFMTGGETNEPAEYGAPTYRNIIAGYGDPDITSDVLEVPIASATRSITVTGLKPDTWYYVYTVLEGGGDPSHVVQIYRVKTDEASPPIVTISPSGTEAVMATYNGDTGTGLVSSNISYAVANSSNLPSYFSYKYYWGSNSTPRTILEAMILRTNGPYSKTLFDEYADTATPVAGSGDGSAPASFKSDIVDYIMGIGTEGMNLQPIDWWPEVKFDANRSTGVKEDFSKAVPDDTITECVVLAVAVAENAGTGMENYGFAAARGLYVPDTVPPEFDPILPLDSSGVTYIQAWDLRAFYQDPECKTNELRNWQRDMDPNEVGDYYFSGRLTIIFDKNVYQSDVGSNNTSLRREVRGGRYFEADDDKIHITDVFFKEGVDARATFTETSSSGYTDGPQRSYTIEFTGLKRNNTLTLLNSGQIANRGPSQGTTKKRLTLQFDPLLRSWRFDPNPEDVLDEFKEQSPIAGGFKATWK